MLGNRFFLNAPQKATQKTIFMRGKSPIFTSHLPISINLNMNKQMMEGLRVE